MFQKNVCEDNKKAYLMTTGLVTTRLKWKPLFRLDITVLWCLCPPSPSHKYHHLCLLIGTYVRFCLIQCLPVAVLWSQIKAWFLKGLIFRLINLWEPVRRTNAYPESRTWKTQKKQQCLQVSIIHPPSFYILFVRKNMPVKKLTWFRKEIVEQETNLLYFALFSYIF